MLLHIGGDFVVDSNTIIGIFDLDNVTSTKRGAEFINTAESNYQIVYVDDNLPKSFIIVKKASDLAIYLSPISVNTLTKRIKSRYLALI